MDKELEPRSAGAAAPPEQVKRSIYSDLEYVSLEWGGRTYGGWYRQLPDGRLELLALANMHSERRPERTAMEQARGMLSDFIRSARRDTADAEDEAQSTLGDLLYRDPSKSRVPEDDWCGLVAAIAAGDRLALSQLFDRTHRIVFTLMLRLVGNRDLAEELTVDVFHDVWRHAAHFDAAGGPVLAWLLDQARLRALERLELQQRGESDAAHVREQAARLRTAVVTTLCADERQLIEAGYFSKLSYRDLAAQLQQSSDAVMSCIHSGMGKLREEFSAGVQQP